MIIDCSVGFGHWPFARFAEETAADLDAALAAEGIDRALVSCADAVLYEEPDECNRWMEARLQGFPRLVPVPVANPRVASWRAIMDRAVLPAVKLIPNYHAFPLGDERVLQLCARAEQRRVPVMIQARVEDERGQYELLQVPGVSVQEITGLAARFPRLSIVVLCAYVAEAPDLAKLPNVSVDISFIETLDTLGSLCASMPAEQVLFGTHTPWFTPRSALAKLRLSRITDTQRELIAHGNAARIFGLK
jgi:uncharacterized protein